MESKCHFDTPPVLFVVFNRIETVQKTLAAIRKAAPKYLFIAADGPRKTVPKEAEKCAAIRQYILENIDWPCQVKTRFQENNLGCRIGVSSAVDWFFSEVEEGIILEDDCLPGEDFFRYAAAALDFYRDDPQVMHINGSSFFPLREETPYSAFFYRYAHIWGWASWRRAWKYYDVDVKNFDPAKLKEIFKDDPKQAKRWIEIMRHVIAEKPGFDTWDFQWTYTVMVRNGWCLSPACNLISNIGTEQSTHDMTSVADVLGTDTKQLGDELKFPTEREAQTLLLENKVFRFFWAKSSVFNRVLKKIKQILK